MRKYPVWAYIAGVAAGMCLLIVLFLTLFQCTVFNRSFVSREMEKYGVADRIGMTQDGLMELYDEVLKYLEDQRDDLVIQVERNSVFRHRRFMKKRFCIWSMSRPCSAVAFY